MARKPTAFEIKLARQFWPYVEVMGAPVAMQLLKTTVTLIRLDVPESIINTVIERLIEHQIAKDESTELHDLRDDLDALGYDATDESARFKIETEIYQLENKLGDDEWPDEIAA